MKTKNLLLLSIFLISCGSTAVETAQESVKTEFEKCSESFRTVQESVIKLKDIFPDEENIEVNFGDFKTDMQTVWFYYAVLNYSGSNSSTLKNNLMTSEGFKSDVWDVMQDVDSEEKFFDIIEKINLQIYPIIEDLENIEPDLNNISKYSEVQRSINQVIKNNNDLKEDLPKVKSDLTALSEDLLEVYDEVLDWYDKAYDEIDEIDEIINEYAKCEESTS